MIELGSVGERIAELEQGMTLLAEELAALRLKFRLGLIDAGDSAQGNVGPGPADYWETVEVGSRESMGQEPVGCAGFGRVSTLVGVSGEKLDAALKARQGSPWNGQDTVGSPPETSPAAAPLDGVLAGFILESDDDASLLSAPDPEAILSAPDPEEQFRVNVPQMTLTHCGTYL